MGQSGGKIELMGTVNGVLNLFCAAIMLLLWGGLLQQQLHKPPREVKCFRYMLFAAFIMMLLESIAWLVLLPYNGWFRFVATLSSVVFFVFLPFYTRYVYTLLHLRSGQQYRLVQMNDLLCAAAAVLLIVNFIHPFIFDHRTLQFVHPAGAAAIILLGGTVLAVNCAWLILYRERIGWYQVVLLVSMSVLPLLSFLLRVWFKDLETFYVLTAFVMIVNYVRLSANLFINYRKQQEKLHSLQIRSTTERMKPHYIYNVLTSIYYLCDTDPKLAQQAVGTFSDYLRSALETLDTGELIDFGEELHTIKSYLKLEQMRFEDRFNVHYDIQTENFLLPPFTVQPLVENAIKHGVETSEQVGEIWIESYETPEYFVVVVRDNGKGFDVEHFQQTKSNFGLRYIQKLLDMTVGGKLALESTVGVGTTVTLRIPKKN